MPNAGQITLDPVLTTSTPARLYHYKARLYDPVLGRFLQTSRASTRRVEVCATRWVHQSTALIACMVPADAASFMLRPAIVSPRRAA